MPATIPSFMFANTTSTAEGLRELLLSKIPTLGTHCLIGWNVCISLTKFHKEDLYWKTSLETNYHKLFLLIL